jgi:flagellar assembly protein FliH
MGLIKAEHTPTTLAAFSMADIEKQARSILLRARQSAERVLSEALKEAEQIKISAAEQGHAQGHAAGLKQGLEEGAKSGHTQALDEHRQSLTALVSALNAVGGDIDAHRTEMEIEAAGEVTRLAIAIASRVTRRFASADPQVVIQSVVEALKLVVHGRDVRIAIHPAQKATLLDALPRLQLEWPALTHVELIDDVTLHPGGCRVFTRQGVVDADIEAQLQRIAADLLPSADLPAQQSS